MEGIIVKQSKKRSSANEANNPDIQPAIDYWLRIKGLLDQAEAMEAKAKELSADLCKWGKFYLRQQAQQTGQKASSITLNGQILYVLQGRYQECGEESVAKYRAALGAEFGTYFTARRYYKLEIEESACPPALKAQLDAAGVQPIVAYKPTDALHVRRMFDDDLDAQVADLQPVQYIQRPAKRKEV